MNKNLIILALMGILVIQLNADSEVSKRDSIVILNWPESASDLTDIRLGGMRAERAYPSIQKHFQAIFEREVGRRLAEGQTLHVKIKDVDLAGELEPWRGSRFQDIRVIRSIYPARIQFSWQLKGPDGGVLQDGEERLISNMTTRPHSFGTRDNLAYERDLIRRWVRQMG